tara:strand:- start:291 stop:1031 length:741 start_codon:yes stop_codon:yes gene_type:complete
MKKKIISHKEFFLRSSKFKKNLFLNKKIKKLSKQLYIQSDKLNWSYQHTWNGEPLLQTPEDVVKMQEVIFKIKPDIILEIGVAWGGMMLFYDTLSRVLPIKKIIGVDIFIPRDLKNRINNKVTSKVSLIEKSSTDIKLLELFKKQRNKHKKMLVHLDSDHTEENVLRELIAYDKILKKGDHLIVGDTIINYIPKQKHRPRNWGPFNNPKTALDKFLKLNKNYKINVNFSHNLILSNNYLGHIEKIK